MRLFVVIMALAAIASCSGGQEKKAAESGESGIPAVQARTVTTGTQATASVKAMLEAYYALKDALVEYDTATANRTAAQLAIAADSVKTDGITDSLLAVTIKNFSGTISAESRALIEEKDLVEKKRSFSMISETMYPLLQSIQYNEAVVYHQMCPMAFNDNETAFWLSKDREVVNPYLGRKHPKYASGMLHCGEVKDSLAFGK
jgi:hypothetical protein